MVWHGGPAATRLTPPHDITGKPSGPHLPEGEGAERLRKIMDRAAAILREHPVNRARIAAGKPAATSVWFWGQGRRPAVPTLKERFGVEGSVISAVDLVNGLGRLAGLERITVPGATGFLDTDYAAKARYGLKSLERHDFLLLHIEAPDEAGHMGRADLKREAIERIDELIIGPLLRDLPALGDFRLAADARSCNAVQIENALERTSALCYARLVKQQRSRRAALHGSRGGSYGRRGDGRLSPDRIAARDALARRRRRCGKVAAKLMGGPSEDGAKSRPGSCSRH